MHGVAMILMGNLHAGGQSNLGHLSVLHRVTKSSFDGFNSISCRGTGIYWRGGGGGPGGCTPISDLYGYVRPQTPHYLP